MSTLAFDLGGTRLKAGLVRDGEVIRPTVEPSPSGEGALQRILEVGKVVLEGDRPDRVGLAVPGLVSGGRVASLPGKLDGLVGVDLAGALSEAFEVDALVINDAVAYGVGEAVDGAGAGAHRVVVMTIGTGVGVAVLEDGQPVTDGPLGAGILGGQIPISADYDGPRDSNGRPGTIEALCRADRLVALAGKDSVADVFTAFEAHEPRALEAVATYRADLSRALAALAHAHAPEVIVVGGGPVRQRGPLLLGVEASVRERLYAGYLVEIRPAALGDGAALVGLSRLAAGS